jgi:hypothetical protein
MLMRGSVSLVALIGVLCATLNGVRALDETKYPDWKGQWVRADSAEIAPWDSRKPWGLGQQPPLTPQYQAIFEANLKQLAAGVKTSDPTVRCIPAAMPRVMMAIHPMDPRAHLRGQGEPECPAQRDHRDRQRADAALDGEAPLSPDAGQGADLVGIRLLRE